MCLCRRDEPPFSVPCTRLVCTVVEGRREECVDVLLQGIGEAGKPLFKTDGLFRRMQGRVLQKVLPASERIADLRPVETTVLLIG